MQRIQETIDENDIERELDSSSYIPKRRLKRQEINEDKGSSK